MVNSETQKKVENAWQRVKRSLIGLLLISSAIIVALPVSDTHACDPNNPNCNSNPGYTGHMITDNNRSKTVYFESVNWQQINPVPDTKMLFGIQVLSVLEHIIGGLGSSQTTFSVKDDGGNQGRMFCNFNSIIKKDNCTATIYPPQN